MSRPLRSIPAAVAAACLLLGACAGDPSPKGEGGPVDSDGDGFTSDVDCDDTDPARYPGAPEACNEVDDDCDGLADLDDPDLLTDGVRQYAVDSDLDGYGDAVLSTAACVGSPMPRGAAENRLDCDDRDNRINPDADERCDGVDNDCDGLIDADDDSIRGLPFWGPDLDGDGYGDAAVGYRACERPEPSWVENASDCDDTADDVFPGNEEVCGDGRDNDCDGADGTPYLVSGVELACGQGATRVEAPVLEVGPLGGDAAQDVAFGTLDRIGVLLTTTGAAEELAYSFEAAPALSAAVEGGPAELWVGDAGSSGGSGAVYAILGAWDSGHATADLELTWTGGPGEGLGIALVALDDQQGDGAPDLLVASTLGLALSPDRRRGAALEPLDGGPGAGIRALRRAGDLDGDGFADVIAAQPGDDGALWVLYGPVGAGDVIALLGDAGAGLGAGIDGGADLDDDGRADLAVGAVGSDAVYLISGGSLTAGAASALAYARLDGPAGSGAGSAVALLGDVNNDEEGDLAVGAPLAGGAGRVFVAAGPFGGVQPLLAIGATIEGAPGEGAGRALAGPGDRNGDGFTDLVVAGDQLITTFFGQRSW